MSYPLQLWEHPNYTGRTSKLVYGEYNVMDKVAIPNNSVSSLVVAPFTSVTLYAGGHFGGDKVTINGPKEIAHLNDYVGNFNDRTSSLIVKRIEPSSAIKKDCCIGATPAYACGEYTPGGTKCEIAMAGYCVQSRMGEEACRNWCRENSVQCDAAVTGWCTKNPTDPYCTCLQSPANVNGIMNPKCIDKKCLDTGYQTTSMKQSACPSVVNCDVKNYLDNSGVVLSSTTPVAQGCGSGDSAAPAPAPSGGMDNFLMLFVFILVLAIAIITGVVFVSRRGIFSAKND